MAENMAFKAVLVMVIYLFASCAAKQNCSEIRCKLLPVKEDAAAEFQSLKKSKNDVRMIHLYLTFGNGSYQPLDSPDLFLPYRWAWAATIDELMLSLSYDYDILSLGLLNRQVSHMDVQLEDKPSGCLQGLNLSCRVMAIAQALLGNVTTKDGSGKHLNDDVVCVAEKKNVSLFEFFFHSVSDIEYSCCRMVKQDRLNIVPKCELNIRKGDWFKAFYVVLNILTLIATIQSPALLLLLPDFVFDTIKECEKEQQHEEEEEKQRQLQQNRFDNSCGEVQETIVEENTRGNDIELVMLTRQSATLPEAVDRNEIESCVNEQHADMPNENSLNDPSSATPKDEDEEKRKAEEIPLDDGSPLNFSTLFYTCKSAEIFQNYSSKLSFNIKLLVLWYCVIPLFFYIYLAIVLTSPKKEYFDEFSSKWASFDAHHLLPLDMSYSVIRIILIISYGVIPIFVILILRPKDLKVECVDSDRFGSQLNDGKLPLYIGQHILRCYKERSEMYFGWMRSCGKVSIIVYKTFRNLCDNFIKTGARRSLRFFWVLLALLSRVCAVIFSGITAAFSLLIFPIIFISFLVFSSPFASLLTFFWLKLVLKFSKSLPDPFRSRVFPVSLFWPCLCFIAAGNYLKFSLYNPFIYVFFSLAYPFCLAFFSCRFVVKMYGYTIIGLIFNLEIAAPIATFVVMVITYLRWCYLKLQTKYKTVKEIIFQEWKKRINESDQEGIPEVTNDTIPKKLFWFVCDTSEVIPAQKEICCMLRDMAIIFFSAFFCLCAIYFDIDSYSIPAPKTKAVTVFVSGTIPMLLLRGMDYFDGWGKIAIERKIKEAVGKYVDEKRWLEPVENTEGVGSEASGNMAVPSFLFPRGRAQIFLEVTTGLFTACILCFIIILLFK